MVLILLVLVSLLLTAQSSLAQQGPTQCHDPLMTRWMLNSEGENPCEVAQDVLRICNPSYNIDWLSSSYSCDNSPGSITAACCCGSPTFALLSACWSCQYNYTMDAVTTTFTSFEKDCAAIPNPLTSYDPIIKDLVDQVDIPVWAKIEPSAGKWDLEGAWRNATPSTPTESPPIPTSYPTMSTSAGLSSAAIVGIIVGSVFGTAVMFILAAIILWRCLGLGRPRNNLDADIRVGKDMGYLDGEYIYVRPDRDQPMGYRSRRDSRTLGVRPLDLNASDVSRELSDYGSDVERPLRVASRSPSRLGPNRTSLFAEPPPSPYAEPPSPFSPARHASQDGTFHGYHPGASPYERRPSLEDGYQHSREYDAYRRGRESYRSNREREDYRLEREGSYRTNRDYRSSRGGHFDAEVDMPRRPISAHFSPHRPSVERTTASTRPSQDQPPFVSRRPISGQFSVHGSRPLSGHFVGSNSRPVSGQFQFGTRRSGQYSDYRTSMARKKEHRVSMRSALRHGSMDSTMRRGAKHGSMDSTTRGVRRASIDSSRRSADAGPRVVRLDERDGRLSREGTGRFSRDGGGRFSRDGIRPSRDIILEGSLSEGAEDRNRQEEDLEEDGDNEDSNDAHAEATGSGYGRRGPQHLRKRSQSARTSCDPGHDHDGDVVQPEASTSTPMPATTPSPGPSLPLAPNPSGVPSKPVRNPLRVTNGHSDSDSGNRPPQRVVRQPSLLARARTLINGGRSSRPSSAGHRSTGTSSAQDSPAVPSSTAWPVPPSAWHQRLPNVLLRNRSGSALSNAQGPRSSTGSDSIAHSDVTSAYHTAQGHHTPLPPGTPTLNTGRLTPAAARSNEGSYRQEVDAGVQLIVESSPQSDVEGGTGPPAYVEGDAGHSTSHARPPQSDPALLAPAINRLSTMTRDTVTSGDWDDSTVSSGVLQTWAAARRPTGFVGTGRVLRETEGQTSTSPPPPIESPRTSREEGTTSMMNASSTAVSSLDEDEYIDGKAMLGAMGLGSSQESATEVDYR